MNINIDKVGLVFLLFIYIYIPPFLRVGTSIIGALFFGLYILKNWKRIARNLLVNRIFLIGGGVGLLLLYAIMAYLRVYGSFEKVISAYASSFYIIIYSLMGTVAICDICSKNDYSNKEVWECVILAGTLQSVLSFAAYFCKPIQTILCELLKNIMTADTINYWRDYRLYGLACGLTFGMPIAQSLIGGMALIYAKRYNTKYYFLVPLLWGSALINGRVTMVIVAEELLLIFFASLKYRPNFKVKRETLLIFTLFAIFLILGILAIAVGGVNMGRIVDPIKELWALLHGERLHTTNGYFVYFFADSKAFVLPSKVNLLFGGGIWNNVSDIGYIYDLWVGGVIYSVMQYIFYFGITKKWYNACGKTIIPVFFGITLFVVNIKGNVFGGMNEFLNLFYLMLGVELFIKKRESEVKRTVYLNE